MFRLISVVETSLGALVNAKCNVGAIDLELVKTLLGPSGNAKRNVGAIFRSSKSMLGAI